MTLGFLPAAHPQIPWDDGSPETLLYADSVGTFSESVKGAGILGGERDCKVTITAGAGSGEAVAYAFPGRSVPGTALLGVVKEAGVSAICTWVWDGVDGSEAVAWEGLGGVDLASGYRGIEFTLTMDMNGGSWTFVFYTDAANYSTYRVEVAPGVAVMEQRYLGAFLDFTPTGAGADFRRVGAIVVVSEGGAGSDSEINHLGFTPIPEPGEVGLVLGGGLAVWGLGVRGRRGATSA